MQFNGTKEDNWKTVHNYLLKRCTVTQSLRSSLLTNDICTKKYLIFAFFFCDKEF